MGVPAGSTLVARCFLALFLSRLGPDDPLPEEDDESVEVCSTLTWGFWNPSGCTLSQVKTCHRFFCHFEVVSREVLCSSASILGCPPSQQ